MGCICGLTRRAHLVVEVPDAIREFNVALTRLTSVWKLISFLGDVPCWLGQHLVLHTLTLTNYLLHLSDLHGAVILFENGNWCLCLQVFVIPFRIVGDNSASHHLLILIHVALNGRLQVLTLLVDYHLRMSVVHSILYRTILLDYISSLIVLNQIQGISIAKNGWAVMLFEICMIFKLDRRCFFNHLFILLLIMVSLVDHVHLLLWIDHQYGFWRRNYRNMNLVNWLLDSLTNRVEVYFSSLF